MLIDVVADVAQTCSPLADGLFYVDCAEEPCVIFVSEADFRGGAAWDDVTCNDPRLAGFWPGQLTAGHSTLEAGEIVHFNLVWLAGTPSDHDPLIAMQRFWPVIARNDLEAELAQRQAAATP